MRYLLKQKVFSFNKFAIKNEAGEDAFLVNGRVFSFGNKLSLQNMQGEELAFIKQKLLTLRKTYAIYRNGTVAAEVQQKLFTLVRNAFSVTLADGGELKIQGSFTDFEYTFTQNDRTIAQVSKRWFSLSDAYGVDIVDGGDEVLILSCAVVIDLIHKK